VSAEFTIAHYLSTLANKYEDQPAIYFKSAFRTFSFSYRAIYERCLRVANYLSQKGINKGDRIMVWSYNGQEYGSILLGCALSGVVAVPVDFSSKADLVEILAEKVGAKHLFHSKRRPFTGKGLSHIHVEDLDQELADVPIGQRDFGVEDEDIYEIVYTSGTTSDPKGVIITNKNIVANIIQAAKVLPLPGGHKLLSVLPLSHMFEQVGGFFYPLYCGCSVTYLYSRKSSAVIETLQRERVNVMVVVPIFLNVLRESILREVRSQGKKNLFSRMVSLAAHLPPFARRILFRKVHRKLGGKLRLFITGGSALDPEIEAFWTALGFNVLPGYGLTEASPMVTFNDKTHKRIGSVGRAVPGMEIKLGPENEIWIQGDNVTPGYYNNPKENEARFAEGWYKTGDIGELDRDGFLFIRGRLKNMIKSASGLNIYPEDIESVLNKIAGVKDSCVIGLEQGGDIRVHAVLLMDKSKTWEMETVRPIIESANRNLQPHQQIQGYTIWPHDDFLRTNTLKIKRSPIVDEIQRGRPADGVIRQSSGDRIYDLLADMAKVDVQKIRPESNLVADLGMDSIARVELATLLEEEFNVEVDESAITAETTVAKLKEIIAAQQREILSYAFPRWAVSWPICVVRAFLRAVFFRVPSLFSWTTVNGRKNLNAMQTPAIFIANHVTHYDSIYLMRALPWQLRKIAAAAAADLFYEIKPEYSWRRRCIIHSRGFISALIINTFPFSRGAHVKKSFEYMGELVDQGWNILLFPEGKLTLTGEMDRFKSGIGLLVQAMQVPVVPVKMDGLYDMLNYDKWIPKRFGRIRITFGRPMHVDVKADPDRVARQFEDAIRRLS
jgi:long-chain acyl-CoA synthetase